MESFNGNLRDELLEVRVLTEGYRQAYNRVRTPQFIGLQATGSGSPSCLQSLSLSLSA